MQWILNDRTTENLIAVLACYKNTNHKCKTMHAYTYIWIVLVTKNQIVPSHYVHMQTYLKILEE